MLATLTRKPSHVVEHVNEPDSVKKGNTRETKQNIDLSNDAQKQKVKIDRHSYYYFFIFLLLLFYSESIQQLLLQLT